MIQPEEVRDVLDPLPVSKIFGVGERTAKRLEAMGVRTIGELASRDRGDVLERFGASGAWIHDLAHGLDARRVNPSREEKSHGMERTFADDLSDPEELRVFLLEFCEEVAFGLREKGLRGKTVTLKARYADFKTVTRSQTLASSTNLGPRIYSVARELMSRVPEGSFRLIGVQVSNLEDVREPVQADLFSGLDDSGRGGRDHEAVTEGLDKLRRKYGRGAVTRGSLVGRGRSKGRDGS